MGWINGLKGGLGAKYISNVVQCVFFHNFAARSRLGPMAYGHYEATNYLYLCTCLVIMGAVSAPVFRDGHIMMFITRPEYVLMQAAIHQGRISG